MPALSALRASLRAQLAALFAATPAFADCDQSKPMSVSVSWDGVEMTLQITVSHFAELFASQVEPWMELKEDERAILRRLSDEPMTGRQIAQALRVDYEQSGIRRFLTPAASLRRLELMGHDDDGYTLTEKGRAALESHP